MDDDVWWDNETLGRVFWTSAHSCGMAALEDGVQSVQRPGQKGQAPRAWVWGMWKQSHEPVGVTGNTSKLENGMQIPKSNQTDSLKTLLAK